MASLLPTPTSMCYVRPSARGMHASGLRWKPFGAGWTLTPLQQGRPPHETPWEQCLPEQRCPADTGS